MGSTSILIGFNEPTGVRPSDAAGSLVDLAPPAGYAEPPRSAGALGGARSWDGSNAGRLGYQALEAAAGASRLRRSMAVEAVLQLATAQHATRYLAQRGKGQSAAERTLWGLKVNYVGPTWTLQMHWQRADGSAATVPASAAFTMPAGPVYVAAVRRWASEASVAVEYLVNGQSLGSVASTHGDIQDGDGGTTLVGVSYADPNYVVGMATGDYLDEVRVSSRERTPEEIALQYDRLFSLPAQGGKLVRSLLPPGDAYSSDPASIVQRELAVLGDGLGDAWAYAEELRRDFLPDRATRALDRWEAVTRTAPGPLDTFAKRRQRVVGHLTKVWGYAVQDVVKGVSGLLAIADDEVQVFEAVNAVADPFASIGAQWYQEPHNGAISVNANRARLQYAIGVDATWTKTAIHPVALRRPVGSDDLVEVAAKIDLAATSMPNNGDSCGVFVSDWFNNLVHFFGIKNDVGTLKFCQTTIPGGFSVLARATYGAIPAGTSVWIRMRREPNTGNFAFEWTQGDGSDGPWTSIATNQAGPVALGHGFWCGVCALAETTPAVAADDVYVDEFRLREPMTPNVFNWYLYADPALSSPPFRDVRAAQAVVDRLKPAHTQGKVCESLALLYDDPNNLFDRDPLGS